MRNGDSPLAGQLEPHIDAAPRAVSRELLDRLPRLVACQGTRKPARPRSASPSARTQPLTATSLPATSGSGQVTDPRVPPVTDSLSEAGPTLKTCVSRAADALPEPFFPGRRPPAGRQFLPLGHGAVGQISVVGQRWMHEGEEQQGQQRGICVGHGPLRKTRTPDRPSTGRGPDVSGKSKGLCESGSGSSEPPMAKYWAHSRSLSRQRSGGDSAYHSSHSSGIDSGSVNMTCRLACRRRACNGSWGPACRVRTRLSPATRIRRLPREPLCGA